MDTTFTMTYNKMILTLLIGTVFLFTACQAPEPEMMPPTTTPQEPPVQETPPPTEPVGEAQDITVNGDVIPAERISQVQEQLGQFSGEAVSADEAAQYLIEETLLRQEASRQGLQPTPQEVEDSIEDQLAFQGITLEEFQETLQPGEYEQILQEQANQLAIQALQEALTPEPTEEEIAMVYEENRELFEAEGMSEEDAREEIIVFIRQEQGQQVLQALINELVSQAIIE